MRLARCAFDRPNPQPRPDRREFPPKRTVAPSLHNNPMLPVRTITTYADRQLEHTHNESGGCSEPAGSAIFKFYAPDVAGDNPCCGPDHFVRVLSASSQPIPTRN